MTPAQLRPATRGGPERLLLEAALGIDSPARWEAWLGIVPLDDADEASVTLLPGVHRQLAAAGYSGTEMGRLQGIYRHAWYRSRLLIDHAERLFASIDAPFAVAGGDLAIHRWAADAGHTLQRLDLVVPAESVFHIIDSAQGLGWRLANGDEPRLDRQRAKGLDRSDGLNLALRWYFADRHPYGGAGDSHWPKPVEGWKDHPQIRTLGPADLLLTILAGDGNRDVGLRWMLDAACLIRQQAHSMNWSHLARTAIQLGLRLRVRDRLRRVDELIPDLVPDTVLKSLGDAGMDERIEHWFLRHSGRRYPWRSLPASWSRHRYEASLSDRSASFLRFAARAAGRRIVRTWDEKPR